MEAKYISKLTIGLFLIAGLAFCNMAFSQTTALIINGAAYITMNGGTSGTPVRFIINQPNAAGISRIAANQGWIVSEGEFNYVQWNISNSGSGTYTVPYNYSGNDIPFSMQITGSGSAGGNVLFSSYHTATSSNLPKATYDGTTSIPNLNNSSGVDNSPHMVDRWWIVDAGSYGTKPTATLTFSFTTAERTASGNGITASDLQAQPFNSSLVMWDPTMLYGSYNAGTPEQVNNAIIPVSNFFRAWVILDKTSALPIELLSFNAVCEGEKVNLNWTSSSETNNDYFSIDRSKDLINWNNIGTIPGSGTSNEVHIYNTSDYSPMQGLSYYRLKQVDFDGNSETFDPIATECSEITDNSFEIIGSSFNEAHDQLTVTYNLPEDGEINIYMIDNIGQQISKIEHNSTKGLNSATISFRNSLVIGIYLVTIESNHHIFTQKIFVH